KSKSKRPILPNKPYEPPPFPPLPSLLDAKPGDDLKKFEGSSPFLRNLIEGGLPLERVQTAIRDSVYEPVYCEGQGAYPLPIAEDCVSRDSISQAIEQHFESLAKDDALAQQKASLKTQLERVLLARETAIQSLEQALDFAAHAREQQEKAELILAYQHQILEGDQELRVPGYDGEETTIRLDPEQTPIENANRLFARAKRAKEGADEAAQQRRRMKTEQDEATAALARLEQATSLQEVDDVRAEADKKRWLHRQVVAKKKEERPHEGHSVRELVSPGGWTVLYGDNATSNDYLTTKVARPNDYWFHVRGVKSAHVILQTQNQPDKVQHADLMFAAKVAVQKSASRHSSYVTVDYTLKKYVRKPKKSTPGFVTYEREKTLHVEQ
ncbi:MAG TPA: NFACT RNA binding domain-containing protein, partial [Fimbriimonadaceae bacterium]|nr:NFACT RNA binding domain-containing protein [Fimbriimonadaceae bacterium]